MRRSAVSMVAAVVVLVLGACGSDDKAAPPASSSRDPNTVVVSAALLLQPVVDEIVEAYRSDHPDVPFEVTGHGEAIITDSIVAREPDVAILPAAWLEPVRDGLPTGAVGAFGRSLAVIAVPAGNVTGTNAFAAGSGLRTAVCAGLTRFGNLGTIVLSKSGVTPDPDTVGEGCEADALQQVAEGRLDAALVFRGGLTVPAGVELLDIDESQNLILDLSFAVISESPNAIDFGAFLDSDTVQQVLAAHGYLP